LKQSDDGKGMILRLRSLSDKPEPVQLTWTDGVPRKLYSCLANEKPQKEIKSDRTILPYGTISYYFEMQLDEKRFSGFTKRNLKLTQQK